MSRNEKGSSLSKGTIPNTLIVLAISGLLFITLPFIERSAQEAGADLINHHPEPQNDYLTEEFLTFHENTLSPFHVFVDKKVKPKTIINEGKEYIVVNTMQTSITAYSSTVDQTDSEPFITASGAWVSDGIIAANFLPFNTKIRIPSLFEDKVFIVKDRMNARHTNRVDIWFPSRQEAINFGLQNAKIEILKEI